MKVTIIGAGGNIGKRISKEALSRNHNILLVTSKNKEYFGSDSVKIKKGDIFNTEELGEIIAGSDVVISAYAPPLDDTDLLFDATKSLIKAVKNTNTRLIAVGGAGSLQISDDLQLVDTPNFPEEFKDVANSHRKVLENIYYNEQDLDWTNVSPSAYIFEGERTNEFRIGKNQLLTNEEGQSSISMEDFAVGILNEVDNKNFIKQRFTIGY